MPDEHIWQISSIGQFSSKSAYIVMFQGAIPFKLAERESGKPRLQASANFLFGWWCMIGVGLLTSLQRGVWITLSIALFMTSSPKVLTTS
jgi:hypothetical protein